MKKCFILVILFFYVFLGCLSTQHKLKKEVQLSCFVDDQFNVKKWIDKQTGIFPVLHSGNFKFPKMRVSNILKKFNFLKYLNPIYPIELNGRFNQYNVFWDYFEISGSYKRTGVLAEDKIYALGDKLKVGYLIVPIIQKFSIIKSENSETKELIEDYGADIKFCFYSVKEKKLLITIEDSYHNTNVLETKESIALKKQKEKEQLEKSKQKKKKYKKGKKNISPKKKKKKKKKSKLKKVGSCLWKGTETMVEAMLEDDELPDRPSTRWELTQKVIKKLLLSCEYKINLFFKGTCTSKYCMDGSIKFIFLPTEKKSHFKLQPKEYMGEWKVMKANGNGTLYFQNGDYFKGEWINGFAHGKGIFTSPRNKTIIEGIWKNGYLKKVLKERKKN